MENLKEKIASSLLGSVSKEEIQHKLHMELAEHVHKQKMRVKALELSVGKSLPVDSAEDIVECAKTYYEFLIGE